MEKKEKKTDLSTENDCSILCLLTSDKWQGILKIKNGNPFFRFHSDVMRAIKYIQLKIESIEGVV